METLTLSHLVEKRFSPRSFSAATVSEEQVALLLEAARRAPSSGNSQPWRFLYALKGDSHYDLIADCLVDNNKVWAPKAPLLLVSLAKERNQEGKPVKFAWHDTGMASAWLTVQATEMGLYVHQMGGYDNEKARTNLEVPEGYAVVAFIAIGYLGHPGKLPEHLQGGDINRRGRNSLDQIANRGVFHFTEPAKQ